MTFRSVKALLIMALLIFVLAACGNNDNSTPNTTSPTQTTTTTDTSGVNLSQSVTTTDDAGGVLTANYPEGWFAQEFGGSIGIGNAAAVFTSNAQSIPSGQVVGTVLALPTEMLGLLGLGDNPTAIDVLANFMNTTLNEDPESQYTVGEPEAFTTNNKNAVIQTGTGTDANGTSDVAFVMVESGGGFILLSFVAPQGEIAGYDAQIRAIAGSAEYTVPESSG